MNDGGAQMTIVAIVLSGALLACSADDAEVRPSATSREPEREVVDLQRVVSEQELPNGGAYELMRWDLPLGDVAIDVVDVGTSRDLAGVVTRRGGDLAINGGFFDRHRRAEGLAVSRGIVHAKLVEELSGGVLLVRGGHGELHQTEGFELPPRTDFAIQCYPRLIVDGEPVIRRSSGKRADRTALCLRSGGRELSVYLARSRHEKGMGGPTLFAFSRLLEREGCDDALNLDGGPSSGAAWREGRSVRSSPPRGPIRHAVVFTL